jgi:hypothetical protein
MTDETKPNRLVHTEVAPPLMSEVFGDALALEIRKHPEPDKLELIDHLLKCAQIWEARRHTKGRFRRLWRNAG